MEVKTQDFADMQRAQGYWGTRKHMLYYKAIYQYVAVVAHEADSIIDVGSGGTGYLSWFDWVPNKTALDFKIPRKQPGIETIEMDFFQFHPTRKYDLGLCLEVLEHLEDPTSFCTKLKDICKGLIITVPYKWLGGAPGHIQDPVDEEKLFSWMKVRPNNWQVVYEPFREGRIVAYYDLENGPVTRFDKGFIFSAIAEHSAFELGSATR